MQMCKLPDKEKNMLQNTTDCNPEYIRKLCKSAWNSQEIQVKMGQKHI